MRRDILFKRLREELQQWQQPSKFRSRIPSFANLRTQPNSPFTSKPVSRSVSGNNYLPTLTQLKLFLEYGDDDNNNDFDEDEYDGEGVYDDDTGLLLGTVRADKPSPELIAERVQKLAIEKEANE